MNLKPAISILILSAYCAIAGEPTGLIRFDALSELETGNNDFAVGAKGERGRYQETEQAYREYLPTIDWGSFELLTNKNVAFRACDRVMAMRVLHFERMHPAPTDFQWYLLWNCPSDVDYPSKRESERAHRFENLVMKLSK